MGHDSPRLIRVGVADVENQMRELKSFARRSSMDEHAQMMSAGAMMQPPSPMQWGDRPVPFVDSGGIPYFTPVVVSGDNQGFLKLCEHIDLTPALYRMVAYGP